MYNHVAGARPTRAGIRASKSSGSSNSGTLFVRGSANGNPLIMRISLG